MELKMKKRNINTRTLVLCALFAALSGVFSQIAIPIGAVPINLAFVSVFIAAGLLGAKFGALSQLVFVLLGAVGMPVFSGFRGGLGVVFGPTGGFIIGYIACALMTGFIAEKGGRKIAVLIPAMCAGAVCAYFFGTVWFITVTGSDFMYALTVCVLPFLPGDALKAVLSSVLVNRLYAVLGKRAV